MITLMIWVLLAVMIIALAIIFSKAFVKLLGAVGIVLLIVFFFFLIFMFCSGIVGFWRYIFAI